MNNHKTKEANEKSEKILDYISANSEHGVTIKDIGIAFNMPAETVRHYVKALFNNGYVDRKQQGYGATHRYFWKKPEDQTQNVMEDKNDKNEEAMGGVERDPDTVIKCGEFCKPGDVVECSSRSGEGLFFKYLVIAPWERKAMVLGIFQEGHPNINLNDPNQIYIGDDPETGKKLYTDITNVCQRGYKTFGKRFFHVEKERMDEVKNRLGRVMQLDMVRLSYDSVSTKLHVENTRLESIIKKLKDEKTDLIDKVDLAKKELAIQCKQYEQQIDDLKATLMITNGAVQDYESRYTLQKKEIEKLKEENHNLTCQNEEFRQQIVEFSHGKEPLDPDYVEGLESRYGDALLKLKEAETKVNCYFAQIEFMRQVIFKAFNNRGGN